MLDLFESISERCAAGERVALCTVIDARGSTPQQRGARMLVTAAGQLMGTLGGGCVEAEVRSRAIRMMSEVSQMQHGASDATAQAVDSPDTAQTLTTTQPLSFRLDHDHGWDDGMWCGGILDVHIELLHGHADAARFANIATALKNQQPATITIPAVNFSETIDPAPPLIIAGAGHVAGALAPLAATLGFAVTVIDDRPDVLLPKRFPSATLIADTVDIALSKLPIDRHTFIVIVTRGHHRDAAALKAVINSEAKYIGMIGSKRKTRTILGQLAEEGVPRETLARVRSPIGLEIGAISVEEIAVSIAAELIAVRRNETRAGEAMKISETELNTWIDRDKLG